MNTYAYIVFGGMAVGYVSLIAYVVYGQLVVWPRAQRELKEKNDRLHAQGLPRDPVKLKRWPG